MPSFQITHHVYIFTLILFVSINMLIYFDRGTIAATASLISDTFDLTKFQEGIISSVFMVGYVLCSPIFAQLPSCVGNSKFVIAIGLFIWVIACVVLLISRWIPGKFGYGVLLGGRILAGVGESAFAPLAPTILDDISPVKWSTTFITLFFACIPVGIALGYGVAGGIGEFAGWQWVFLLQAILMFAMMIPLCCAPTRMHPTKAALYETSNRTDSPDEDQLFQVIDTTTPKQSQRRRNIFRNMFDLVTNPVYVFSVLGSSVYTGVLGALSFWGPSFFSSHLNIDLFYSNLAFSLLSVVIGLSATSAGGLVLSLLIGSKEKNVELVKQRKAAYSLLCCFLCLLVATPLGLVAFISTNVWVCFTFIALGEFFLFMITSPMNVSVLSCVPDSLRDFSMSVDIFLIHLLGDCPSPAITGLVAEYTDNFALTMGGLWSILFLGVLFYLIGWLFALRRYRKSKRNGNYEEIEFEAVAG